MEIYDINLRSLKLTSMIFAWIHFWKPKSAKLAYRKACIESRTKGFFLGTLFSSFEVKQIYYVALEKAKEIDNFNDY